MRTIHSERYWRFFCLRPAYANFKPRSTASLAERYSFDLVRKYPLARSNIFLRLARRLVPRFTRGMLCSFFIFNLAAGGRMCLFTRCTTAHVGPDASSGRVSDAHAELCSAGRVRAPVPT